MDWPVGRKAGGVKHVSTWVRAGTKALVKGAEAAGAAGGVLISQGC